MPTHLYTHKYVLRQETHTREEKINSSAPTVPITKCLPTCWIGYHFELENEHFCFKSSLYVSLCILQLVPVPTCQRRTCLHSAATCWTNIWSQRGSWLTSAPPVSPSHQRRRRPTGSLWAAPATSGLWTTSWRSPQPARLPQTSYLGSSRHQRDRDSKRAQPAGGRRGNPEVPNRTESKLLVLLRTFQKLCSCSTPFLVLWPQNLWMGQLLQRGGGWNPERPLRPSVCPRCSTCLRKWLRWSPTLSSNQTQWGSSHPITLWMARERRAESRWPGPTPGSRSWRTTWFWRAASKPASPQRGPPLLWCPSSLKLWVPVCLPEWVCVSVDSCSIQYVRETIEASLFYENKRELLFFLPVC